MLVSYFQDFLVNSPSSQGSSAVIFDKSQEDSRLPSKPRGWLNWLSRGMLSAGGTDDSSQFSGVISDDVIKVYISLWALAFINDVWKGCCILIVLFFLRILILSVQDIYEVTKFHPAPSLNGDISVMDEVFFSSIKFNIREIYATLLSV